MAKLEYKHEDGHVDVSWTDAYGNPIVEGSLITYAVRRSRSMNVYRAVVIRTDSRYIYIQVDDNSFWRKYRNLPRTRNARLYATNNIIVYGRLQPTLILNDDNTISYFGGVINLDAVPEVL